MKKKQWSGTFSKLGWVSYAFAVFFGIIALTNKDVSQSISLLALACGVIGMGVGYFSMAKACDLEEMLQ